MKLKPWNIRKDIRYFLLFGLVIIFVTSCSTLAEIGDIAGLLRWPREIRTLRQEVVEFKADLPNFSYSVPVPSTDMLMNWITGICQTPHRRPGSPENHQAERWLLDQFKALNLQSVTEEKVPITVWEASKWQLSVNGSTIPSFFTVYTAFTGSDGVTAPLVYVGEGTEEDFSDVDARGKIVVADVVFGSSDPDRSESLIYFKSDPNNKLSTYGDRWNIGFRKNFPGNFFGFSFLEDKDVYKRAVEEGAIGIALILKDQPSAYNSHYGPYDGVLKPIPGVWIGKYDGERLRAMAKQGLPAQLTLEGTTEDGYMSNIWGVLPGQSDEIILVTSHIDSPHKGAVEDGSGIAQVLAQAWAWSQVPQQERPKTLVFVGAAGHMYSALGGYYFAKNHPDLMERTEVLITLEHIAAKNVREGPNGRYEFTGETSPSAMLISHDVKTVSATWKAVEENPVNAITGLPTFGFFPPSDAAGFVFGSTGADLGERAEVEEGIPFVSWISDPYYLLDEADTLDKIDQPQLVPSAKLVTELVKNFMVMD